MPKAVSKTPVEDRRLQQRGKVVVSKFLALLQQTDAKGLLIIEANESGKKTLLSITSGLDWKDELNKYQDYGLEDTVALHLRSNECIILEKRQDLRKSSEKRRPLTWMAKLPVEGAAQQVRQSIGETQQFEEELMQQHQQVPQLSTVDILQENLSEYFGTPEEEHLAVQKMRTLYELEPVPPRAYLQFPDLKFV